MTAKKVKGEDGDGAAEAVDGEHATVVTQMVRGADKLSVDRFRLNVIEGPDAGASFASSGDRVTIGTGDSADLVLHDRTVSRFHCDIASVSGRIVLRDLGSSNGTLVDGVWVVEAHLRVGALLTLGRSKVRFDIAEDRATVAVSPRERFGLLVGKSLAMRRVFAALERAATSDATVLLEGETGTGKEAATESLHTARDGGPLVVVDCGAIPRELLESELFGHERGAFTGAVRDREGAFEAASGGTLFLDEIGELPLDLQPKLLRALERREIKRVGGNTWKKVDIHVVAGTNRSLRGEVNAGRFRADLYYRLAVLEVRMPPLRERREDLPLLVEHLLVQMDAATRPEAELVRTPAFLAEIERHPWPGNVRELRNYLERCLAMREQPPLEGEARPDASTLATVPLRAAREALDRRYLVDALARADGNVSAAARIAGVDRITFYRLLWRHGLR